MRSFIDRFSGLVNGTISGFDSIVFKGLVFPLTSAAEVMEFCRAKGILNKSYKECMPGQTKHIINTTTENL